MSYVCLQFRSGYDAMQLSSGIPGAFSYRCWQFRSDMMLCDCQVAFLRHLEQENFTALKLELLGTQLHYSKIKLVNQFRSASVCDNVINLHNVVSRMQ